MSKTDAKELIKTQEEEKAKVDQQFISELEDLCKKYDRKLEVKSQIFVVQAPKAAEEAKEEIKEDTGLTEEAKEQSKPAEESK